MRSTVLQDDELQLPDKLFELYSEHFLRDLRNEIVRDQKLIRQKLEKKTEKKTNLTT